MVFGKSCDEMTAVIGIKCGEITSLSEIAQREAIEKAQVTRWWGCQSNANQSLNGPI